MTEPPSIEQIVVLEAMALTTLGIGLTAYNVLINSSDIYNKRNREYKDAMLVAKRDSIKVELTKPTKYEAFKDSARFQWHFLRSSGKINTENYNFDTGMYKLD